MDLSRDCAAEIMKVMFGMVNRDEEIYDLDDHMKLVIYEMGRCSSK
jgi:hypothetical protein